MRLRDLLHLTPPVVPHHDPRVVRAAADRHPWRSEACRSDSPVEHARCSHPANRFRYDGCSCPCHHREAAA